MLGRAERHPHEAEQLAPHSQVVALGWCRQVTGGQLLGRHHQLQRAFDAIDPHDIAIAHPRQRATVVSLGAHMDGRRDLARSAGHPPVGDQRHFVATVLQHP